MLDNAFFVNRANQSLSELLPRIVADTHKIAAKSEDFVLTGLRQNRVQLTPKDMIQFQFGRDLHQLELTSIAQQQLFHKIKMPLNYYNMLSISKHEDMRHLANFSVNTLLSHADDRMLVRTYKDSARAFLSPNYTVFDSDQVADVISDVLKPGRNFGFDELLIRNYYVDCNYFNLRFTTSSPVRDLYDKDLYFGLQITSSDVGVAMLRVKFWVYKQVCTNGMCMSLFNKHLFSLRHLGNDKDSFYNGLQRSLMVFPDLTQKATAMISKSEQLSFEGKALLKLSQHVTEENLEREYVKKYLQFSDSDMDRVATLTVRNYSPTLWGYCNAITEFAQTKEYNRRMELERMSGKLMEYYLKSA